jgi:hypothetical protein
VGIARDGRLLSGSPPERNEGIVRVLGSDNGRGEVRQAAGLSTTSRDAPAERGGGYGPALIEIRRTKSYFFSIGEEMDLTDFLKPCAGIRPALLMARKDWPSRYCRF